MKLYVCDLSYAATHENELRKLRLAGNMIALCSDFNRQALMRKYRTLANYYIADHGEFAFSGCYILFEERSPDTGKVIELLEEHHISYRFAYPYTNACGGQDVKYASDRSLTNEYFTYAVHFASDETKEEMRKILGPYCVLAEAGDECGLCFRSASYEKALKAIMEHESVDEENIVFLR